MAESDPKQPETKPKPHELPIHEVLPALDERVEGVVQGVNDVFEVGERFQEEYDPEDHLAQIAKDADIEIDLDKTMELLLTFVNDEEARDVVFKERDFPPKAARYFGLENVQALAEVLNDSQVKAMDMMVMKGDISAEEFNQYFHLMPEFAERQNELQRIAKQMIQEVSQIYPQHLLTAGGKLPKMFPVEKEFFRMVMSQHYYTETPNYTNALLVSFLRMLFEEHMIAMFKYYFDATRYHEVIEIYGLLKDYCNLNLLYLENYYGVMEEQQEAILFAGALVELLEEAHVFVIIAIDEFEEKVDGFEVSDEEQLSRDFTEIVELAEDRIIEDIQHIDDKFYINISEGVLEHENEKNLTICTVDVGFFLDDKELFNLPLFLNRFNGELQIHWEAMPLSEIVPPETYAKLKSFVYKMLLEYLKAKDPDNHEVDLTSPKEYKQKMQDGLSEITDSLEKLGEVIDGFGETMEVEFGALITELKVLAKDGRREKQDKKEAFDALTMLPARRVDRALRKILGKPSLINKDKNGGSHMHFLHKDHARSAEDEVNFETIVDDENAETVQEQSSKKKKKKVKRGFTNLKKKNRREQKARQQELERTNAEERKKLTENTHILNISPSQCIKYGTFRSFLREVGLSVEEFMGTYKKC